MEKIPMKSSIMDPTRLWDEHVKTLESMHFEAKEAEAHLESVREKRESPRIRSLYLTSYIPKKGKRQVYIISIGRTLDVSKGGAKIETHRQLDIGTKLELEIAVEDRIIAAKGEVVYSEKIGAGLFGTGISFISIDEEDRRLLR
jgi:hypothetical protein